MGGVKDTVGELTVEMQYGSNSRDVWEVLCSVGHTLQPHAGLTALPKDKRPRREVNECIECNNCLMVSFNLEMHFFWWST